MCADRSLPPPLVVDLARRLDADGADVLALATATHCRSAAHG